MRLRILLLAANDPAIELLASCLRGCDVTLVRRPEEVPAKLAMKSYRLVIVTNLGLPPAAAVAVVPTVRDYPVLFLTGHVDAMIESTCATKNIPIRQVPIDSEALRREFRLALDEPGE